MTGNGELFDADDTGSAPSRPGETGSFDLGALFGDSAPIARAVEPAPAAEPDSEPEVLVEVPPVVAPVAPPRPLRADGAVDAARRPADDANSGVVWLPRESAPVAPERAAVFAAEPVLREPAVKSAPPARELTEPLAWLTADEIAQGSAGGVAPARPRSNASSLGGLVRDSASPAPATAATRAERVEVSVPDPEPPRPAARPTPSPRGSVGMTPRDWTISAVSLVVTAAAVFGIVALLQ